MSGDASEDEYASSAGNLRDSAKWLIATFAAPLAVLIGTSPLTRLSSLHGSTLFIALGSGATCALMAGWAIKLASDVLIQRTTFLSEVAKDEEIVALVNEHHTDFLPPPLTTLDAFLVKRKANIDELSRTADSAKRKALLEDNDVFNSVTSRLLGYASYNRLAQKFELLRSRLFFLATVGVVSLGTYVAVTTSGASDEPSVKVTCATPATLPAGK